MDVARSAAARFLITGLAGGGKSSSEAREKRKNNISTMVKTVTDSWEIKAGEDSVLSAQKFEERAKDEFFKALKAVQTAEGRAADNEGVRKDHTGFILRGDEGEGRCRGQLKEGKAKSRRSGGNDNCNQ